VRPIIIMIDVLEYYCSHSIATQRLR